jgi:hypothetical protein
MLDAKTAGIIKSRVSSALQPDIHTGGRYRVNNLYFDDMYRSAYMAKQTGAFIRDKYRIRYYNNDLTYIRLEHKHKKGELAVKQSIIIPRDVYHELVNGGLPSFFDTENPLARRFSHLYRLKRLRPTVSFSYYREAFTHPAGNVRITFDNGIPGGNGVLELKYTQYLPCFVPELLTGLPLMQVEASKFCMASDNYKRSHIL